jgi:hypothetical protein
MSLKEWGLPHSLAGCWIGCIAVHCMLKMHVVRNARLSAAATEQLPNAEAIQAQ